MSTPVPTSPSSTSRALGTQSPSPTLINSNRTEVASLRLSPYVRGPLGGVADYEARLSWEGTNTKNSNADSSSTEALLRVSSSASTFTKLGWSADYSRQIVHFDSTGNQDLERLNGVLTFAATPEAAALGTRRLRGQRSDFAGPKGLQDVGRRCHVDPDRAHTARCPVRASLLRVVAQPQLPAPHAAVGVELHRHQGRLHQFLDTGRQPVPNGVRPAVRAVRVDRSRSDPASGIGRRLPAEQRADPDHPRDRRIPDIVGDDPDATRISPSPCSACAARC